MLSRSMFRRCAALGAAMLVAGWAPIAQAQQAPPEPAMPLGALAPSNLKKPRPAPPFDLTGTWLNDLRFQGSWRFGPPPPGVKLTPEAQKHFDAARQAQAEGKVYRDDIGQCWPAGLPMIMTRVWPIAMVQVPTAIYMVSGFMNSLRIVYLDRPHSDPDVVVRSFNGESVGRWEKDTLVVDSVGYNEKFWMTSGGLPHTEALHLTERFTRTDMNTLKYEVTIEDPRTYTRAWTAGWTLQWIPDQDIQEYFCEDYSDFIR